MNNNYMVIEIEITCQDYELKCPGENKCAIFCNSVKECTSGFDEQTCGKILFFIYMNTYNVLLLT